MLPSSTAGVVMGELTPGGALMGAGMHQPLTGKKLIKDFGQYSPKPNKFSPPLLLE